jgi:hypothetical protein
MTFRRFLLGSTFTGALVALFSLGSGSACTSTEIVDVTIEGDAEAAAPTLPDAATDSPVDAADAADANDGKCHPISASGFTTAPYAPPTGAYQGLCTDAQIASFIDCANGNMAACADAQGDGGSCLACIESRSTDPKWGPLVITGASSELNEAGCVALANNDTTTTGCGQANANYTGCLHYTCRDACPDTLYFACAVETVKTSCKAFTSASTAACSTSGSDCYALPSDGANDLTKRLIKRFCGSM